MPLARVDIGHAFLASFDAEIFDIPLTRIGSACKIMFILSFLCSLKKKHFFDIALARASH